MTKEELQQKAETYMEGLKNQPNFSPFYDWDVKRAYMDGLMEGEKECEHDKDANGEMLVKFDAKELQELVEKAKNEALAELRKEFGWHQYPQEKPARKGDYVVRFKNSSRARTLEWDEKYPWIDVAAWMPIPEEGGEE